MEFIAIAAFLSAIACSRHQMTDGVLYFSCEKDKAPRRSHPFLPHAVDTSSIAVCCIVVRRMILVIRPDSSSPVFLFCTIRTVASTGGLGSVPRKFCVDFEHLFCIFIGDDDGSDGGGGSGAWGDGNEGRWNMIG